MRDYRVAIFTRVYKYEDKIIKSIESVLNQTYKNIRYYVLVSNETKYTLEKYAAKDDRVIVLTNDENNPEIGFKTYVKQIIDENNDYVCTLDADDYYHDTFIEKMIKFVDENNLDIAACGSIFETVDGKKISERKSDENIILQKADFAIYYTYYHRFFRPIWGKIYSAKVINKLNIEELPHTKTYGGYGGDTIFTFRCLKYADKMGILKGVLHNYTCGSNFSSSKVLSEGRVDSDEVLFNEGINFLSRYGDISEKNYDFLLSVYEYAMIDTLRLVINCKLEFYDKLKNIIIMFNKDTTKKLFAYKKSRQIIPFEKYRKEIVEWICLQINNNMYDKNALNQVFEIFKVLYWDLEIRVTFEEFEVLFVDINLLRAYLNKEYEFIFKKVISKLNSKCIQLNAVQESLLKKMCSSPIVSEILSNIKFISKYKDIIIGINDNENKEALEKVQIELEKDINITEKIYLGNIALNLSAFLEETIIFINMKALMMQLLTECGMYEQAIQHFIDLQEMGVEGDLMIEYRKVLFDH